MLDRHDAGLRILTSEDCTSLLKDLRTVLAEADLKLEDMDLWSDLEDLRWLASLHGPVLQGSENDQAPSRKRRLQGFKDAVSIKRSIKAIELTRDYEGWRLPAVQLIHWRIREITGNENTLAPEQAQQSMNFLYEIEVASRLGITFSKVKFAEPDLVIESPELPVAWSVACKRTRSLKAIPRLTRDAVKQIARHNRLSVIMISIDNVLEQFVTDLSGKSLQPECQARMSKVIDSCSTAVLQRISISPPSPADAQDPKAGRGVLGVLTTANFILLGRDGPTGPAFLNRKLVPSMINRNEPRWARAAVYFLLQKLESADQQLRTAY